MTSPPALRLTRFDMCALAALGLAVRLPPLFAFPGVHGGDAVARLAMSDRLVLAYQLPLPQLLVFLARAVHPDPLWARLAFVLVGAAVPVALARVVAALDGPLAGRAAGALLALHPLLVYYSLVPYQEGLMLLGLLLGANALLARRERRASLSLGLACLCRYEAWIAAALAAVARRRGWLVAALRYGWAPALWVLTWRGLSPSGSYVLDLHPTGGRLARLSFLIAKLREYSGDALVLLALIGLARALWRPDRRWAWGGAYLALFTLVVVAAGHEFPPGSGLVSERLIHVPAVALCALAGSALGALGAERSRWGWLVAAVVVAVIGVPAVGRAQAQVREANRDPSLQLAVAVAERAGRELRPGDVLAVAAPPVPAAALDDYVRKIERVGGDTAHARALAISLSSRSPDATRIAAQLARPPASVVEAGTPAALVAVYDDAPEAARWRTGTALARYAAGTRAVTLYRP